jgi:hypothetical protein
MISVCGRSFHLKYCKMYLKFKLSSERIQRIPSETTVVFVKVDVAETSYFL